MTNSKRDVQAVIRGEADVEYATAPGATGRSDVELQRVRAKALAALNHPKLAKMLAPARQLPTPTVPTASVPTASEGPNARTSAAAARAERHIRRMHQR